MVSGHGKPKPSDHAANRKAAPKRPKGYGELSTDPLHILVFVLPLVVFYELMLFFSDLSGVADTVAAHEIINRAVGTLGDFGLYLPGLLLVGVLIVMKLSRGDAWRLRLGVIPAMAIESAAWAIPLLLIAAMLSATPAVQAAGQSAGDAVPLNALPLQSRIALSIGAGLYEELLFRLLAVSVLAFALRSVFRVSDTLAAGLAIGIAALAFTFYHQPVAGVVPLARRIVYFVAGCFLGLLFVLRGFGIVVGAHAAYDLFVLVLLGSGQEIADE